MFLLLVLIISSSFASGFGLMPSSTSILYDENVQEYTLYIVNSESKDLELSINVNGDLSSFVSVQDSVSIPSSKGREEVLITFNLPQNHGFDPGTYDIDIVVSDKSQGSGQVSAKIRLISTLRVTIPSVEAFLDIKLFAPDFDKDKGGNFVVQVKNSGSENAVDVIPVIDIYSSANKRLGTLRGSAELVRAGKTVNFPLSLDLDLDNGVYSARASVIYSGASNNDIESFNVGSPEVLIDDISAMSFSIGGVAGFDIFLENLWGEEISGIYADVEFRKDDELLEETRTASIDIQGMGRSRVQAFWDTKGMSTGIYELVIYLNYLDKRERTAFDIVLKSDNIDIRGLGRVIDAPEESDNNSLLVVVVFFLVVLNGFLIYKYMSKKK